MNADPRDQSADEVNIEDAPTPFDLAIDAAEEAGNAAGFKALADISTAVREAFHKNASPVEIQFMEDLQGFGYVRVLKMLEIAFPYLSIPTIDLNGDHPEYPGDL